MGTLSHGDCASCQDALAASCLGWLDARNTVGELEPVGTDPEFRRLRLARTACLAAMRALRAAGATRAIVYPVHGHPNGTAALYESLGFTPYARTVTYGIGRVGRVAVKWHGEVGGGS